MCKLKLQVQITIDGFMARPDGSTDWMWGDTKPGSAVDPRVMEIANSCDTILLGRKMTPVFVSYWEDMVDNHPESPVIDLAHRMVDMRKITFTRSGADFNGRNLEVEGNDLVTAVKVLKEQPGKDIIVYGGAGFVTSLIAHNLVDEYYLFRNPVAIGEGMRIFTADKRFKLESVMVNPSGKSLEKYLPL